MATIQRWLAGDQPLSVVFWDYAIIGGFALNLVTTLAALAVVTLKWPPALALALHLLPLPYNLASAVAVWRSAGRAQGSQGWGFAARVVIVPWTALLCLA